MSFRASYSSSPASSPVTYPDSSPPSSPGLEPLRLDVSDDDVYLDPFSGSSKAIRHHRIYDGEKKRVLSFDPQALEPASKRARYGGTVAVTDAGTPDVPNVVDNDSELLDMLDESFETLSPLEETHDAESALWDSRIAACVDNASGDLDMSCSQLTTIPGNNLLDLVDLYIQPSVTTTAKSISHQSPQSRMFQRVQTAPVPSGASHRLFKKTSSVTYGRDTASTGGLVFNLSTNMITSLPRELFCLQKLEFLSLANNQLTVIPPEITQLANLRSLNVSRNHLAFLPSELLDMKLEQLTVIPNALFVRPPQPFSTKPVSAITSRLGPVIPLAEMCYRRLLTSEHPESSSKSILHTHHTLPLDEDVVMRPRSHVEMVEDLPLAVHHLLNVCAPGSVCVSPDAPSESVGHEGITGASKCPSPRHATAELRQLWGSGLFVLHAEERFTWERKLVNGTQLGDAVPFRWRGCQAGCLDFLDPPTEAAGEVEMAVDEDAAVQPMMFSSALGGTDFEDE